jgi:hypothetical protein
MTTPTPQPYQPVVAGYATAGLRRPPLTRRQKAGASWGGIVGFNLLTLGFSLFLLPLFAAVFWSIFVFFVANLSKSLNGSGKAPSLGDFGVDFGLWVIPGVLVSVAGLALMAVAVLVSRAILKRHGVNRPGPVTWAGAGIAIVGFWFLSWIPALLVQAVSRGLSSAEVGWGENLGISAVALVLVTLVGNSVIGWLAWWWMAHALRRDATAVASATMTTTQE